LSSCTIGGFSRRAELQEPVTVSTSKQMKSDANRCRTDAGQIQVCNNAECSRIQELPVNQINQKTDANKMVVTPTDIIIII
jgi:hypothetical protein